VGPFNTIPVQGGKIVLFELALENMGIYPKNLHAERIEIKRVPQFLWVLMEKNLVFTILLRKFSK